jgi:tRNA pseudouridine32 synthase / 23S rRNA pseudouridine746 synthase
VSRTSRFVASDIAVLHRDQHLLVLDKPVGLATTQPDGQASLFTLARVIDPRAPALHPLSRLDTQVSGLVTFARTSQANALALEARRTGQLRRAYLGIISGTLAQDEGDLHWAIAIDPRDPRHRMTLPSDAPPPAKPAHTRYRLQARAGELCALHLWPVTGRTHQLRVHMRAFGHPLLGDVAYDGARRLTLANGRILSAGRTMLHCAAFRMPNPARPEESIELTCRVPDDLAMLWRAGGGDPEQLALRA